MYFSLIILVTSPFLLVETKQLETVYEWRYIDFTWPSKERRQEAIRTGDYDISQLKPMDLAMSQDGRIFMTIHSKTRVRSILGVITNKTEAESGPLIQPYPSWDWAAKKSCDTILKPLRIEIDRCNRLWVMDSSIGPLGEERQCHPKLLAFDLRADTLIYNIELPENIATNARTNLSLMASVKVETHGQYCEDTTVTIARDRTRLDYINSMHIIRPNIFGEEELWMLSNRLVRHKNLTVWNPKEINFRILRSPVEQLIAGTPYVIEWRRRKTCENTHLIGVTRSLARTGRILGCRESFRYKRQELAAIFFQHEHNDAKIQLRR
ncbi:hypothetical protein QAD02_009508 [Eretmocerus hayati]|uniref:Uncharacterized protein n=1 Tax=Eretmocerus hayati TaxID=131215 RepID=A0ACC2NE14_9HYME|nr:hypothetical protein QAD02_009508 [Eretmocerus hayati]